MLNYSPVSWLFNRVAASPFRIAPEGAEALSRELEAEQILLEYVEDDPAGLRSKVLAEYDTEKKVVRLGNGFLEALWAAAHVYLVAMRGYQDAQAEKKAIFDVSTNLSVRTAYELYLDRLASLASHAPTAWPKGASRPIPYPYAHSDGFATDELFLVATGWIVHHELAHARLGHADDATNSMEQEHEADTEATRKVCASPANAQELTKRTLGIVTAVLLLIAKGHKGKSPSLRDPSADLRAASKRPDSCGIAR